MISVRNRRWMARLIVAALLWPDGRTCPAEPQAELPEGTLQLSNGGFLTGRLLDPASAHEVAWQGTHFTAPFRFPLIALNSVTYPQPDELPLPTGDFCFELAGGDVLYGNLRGVTDELIELDESRFGRLSVRRDHLLRFYRNSSKELIYSGPAGLKDWTAESPGEWQEDGGHLVSQQPGTQLRGDLKLPRQAVLEFEVSWRAQPNFAIALGTSARPEADERAFRLEIVDLELVAHRETALAADLAVVTPIGPGEGRVQFVAYLDQLRGRLLVYSITGSLLADLQVPEAAPQPGTGVTLANIQGDVRLERLRVNRWSGIPPTGAAGDAARFQSTSGEAAPGRLAAFDSKRQTLSFRDGDQDTPLHLDQIQEIVLNSPSERRADDAPPDLHLVYLDGARFSGTMQRLGATEVALTSPSLMDPVTCPVAGLRLLKTTVTPNNIDKLSKRETLELPGLKVRGQLTPSASAADASCLAWQPDSSKTASPLKHGVSGRIVYRAPPPPPAKAPQQIVANNNIVRRRQMQEKLPGIGILTDGTALARATTSKGGKTAENRFLHLRSGDTIPCEVTAIDERGVTFQTAMSDATFVPHDQIKAVELLKTKALPKLGKLKRDRLLTLPRMQRDSPPTQLICSPAGDILRGRILQLTDTTLKLEVRLDVRELERQRVAQIIWLHPEELGDNDSTSSVTPPKTPADKTRVQVQRSDGIRLTYFAEQLQETTLSGRSDLLGECRTDLAQVDQLLIGDAIEQAASALAYHRWKLHHAADPKFMQDENGDADASQDSPLVGKPAPDFTLNFLDGEKFHLADTRGEVVVLEFWATWCGFCLQALPQVAEVVEEFRDSNVRLVAVNLEETPKQILATLERHKLEIPVVLDQDGVAAHRYAAHALPQTVVIDRAGNVHRVFIGGDIAEPLRAALKTATELQAAEP